MNAPDFKTQMLRVIYFSFDYFLFWKIADLVETNILWYQDTDFISSIRSPWGNLRGFEEYSIILVQVGRGFVLWAWVNVYIPPTCFYLIQFEFIYIAPNKQTPQGALYCKVKTLHYWRENQINQMI